MPFLSKLTLKQKGTLAIWITLLMLAIFSGIIFYSLSQIRTEAKVLEASFKNLQTLRDLGNDTERLSGATKSFILTQDPEWEAFYDAISKRFDANLEKYKRGRSGEKDILATINEFEKNSSHLIGKELLIISKVREGKIDEAKELFDTEYDKASAQASNLMNNITSNEQLNVDVAVGKIENQIANFVRGFLVATVILIILYLGVSYFLIETSTGALNNLITAAKSIESGELTKRVPVVSGDELGILAGTFNEMAEKLQESYAGLEEKVKEKTLELTGRVAELEETKRAFLNLLEDEKELEFELRTAKTSVEKKVEERTLDLKKARDQVTQGWLELQKEKAKLTSSIESLSLGFVITDSTGAVLLTNPAVNKILGEDKQKWSLDELQAVLGSKYNLKAEIELCMKDPVKCIPKTLEVKSKFVKSTICPIIALDKESKETFGAAIVLEDTTEAKLLERAKDEFFSIASHELRTPLTAIRGNSSLMKDFFGKILDKNPEMAEMVDDMHESSIRLIKIVNDFLDTSRLEQHKVEFKKEAFDLAAVAGEVAEQLKPMGSQKGLTLTLKSAKNLPQAFGDKDKAAQIIYNLLGNAVNYTQKGGVAVSLASKDGLLEVKVTDTGVGISPENQMLLFRKFQQAGEKILTRDVTRGTGLGLYISNLLAQGMGGKVYLESSEVGKGSTFVFILPAVKQVNSSPFEQAVRG